MNKTRHRRRQRGYSLAEVLIASAVGAGILAAVSTALGGAAHLSARNSEAAQILSEAKSISTRLKAGIVEDEILAGLSRWRLAREPYGGAFGEGLGPFEIVSARYGENDQYEFEFLARRRGGVR